MKIRQLSAHQGSFGSALVALALVAAVLFCIPTPASATWNAEHVDIWAEVQSSPYGCEELMQIRHDEGAYSGWQTPSASDCKAISDYVTLCYVYGTYFRAKQNVDDGRYVIDDVLVYKHGDLDTTYGHHGEGCYTEDGVYWCEYHTVPSEDFNCRVTYAKNQQRTYNYYFDGVKDNSLSSTAWTTPGHAYTYAIPSSQTKSGNTYLLTGWSGATGDIENALGAQSGTWSTPTGHSLNYTVTADTDSQVNWLYSKAHNLTINLNANPTLDAGTLATLASPQPHSAAQLVLDGDVQLSVNQYFYDDAGATDSKRYRCTGWSGGTGNLSIPGSGVCNASGGKCALDFTLNSETSLAWNYLRQVVFYSTFSSNVPQSARNNLDPYPPVCTGYSGCGNWYDYNSSQSPSVYLKAQDNTGTWWLCDNWTGSINGVTQSGSGNSAPAFNITSPSWIQWNCGQVRSLEVTVTGLPSDLISGFAPTVAEHDVSLGAHQLSAPETIYDTSGDNRYVLAAYSYNDGTNTVKHDVAPADDECAGDATKFCRTVTVSANSVFNWHYRKEVKLSVAVNGLSAAALASAKECGGVDNADLCIGWANSGGSGAVLSGSTYYPENTAVVATSLTAIAEGGSTKTLISAVVYGAPGATEYSANGRKAFTFVVMNPVRLTWLYEQTDIYDVGQPISVPAGANGTVQPTVTVPGIAANAVWDSLFYWGGYPRKLYALQPVNTFAVSWTPLSGTIPVNSRPSLAKWPDLIQTHVMNAPVSLKPAGSPYSFARVAYSSIPADRLVTTGGIFNASAPGVSTLLFVVGSVPDEQNYPVNFVVAETMPWEDGRVVEYRTDVNAIGTPIEGRDYDHADPEGKNGFVYYERSFYDGEGQKRAYDRSTRKGRILPVNRAGEGDRERQMVVIWYAVGANGLGWPVRPVRYLCDWPAGAEEIVIADGLGYGPLNPSLYPNAFLYVQPSLDRAGYNPNEEHALIFSSTVYAARDDLNTLRGTTTSEPYVLVKYADTSVVPASWAMKVLKVTRGIFSYDIDVGKPIQPPAPLSLWIPYPQESSVVSGEKYRYRTYNGTFWAIASNLPSEPDAEIGLNWFYPMQPGFFYPDFNRDGLPDAVEGDPIPFLNGGQDPDDPPLTIYYHPQWPAIYNALKVGQTLTTGGNGLPDVFHMTVAKVIYDQGVYRGDGPLAKLIEPLAWRQVSLAAIPAGVKTEKVDGRLRFPDLPFYLRSRLSYNELSKKLIFEGTFDDSQGGDPFLLLDVMNLRERDVLADPDEGGSSAWVPSILELFNLSRNPRNLAFSGTIRNPFNPSLTHTAAEWQSLWGLYLGLDRDGAGNPIPLQVKGVNMALTTGMARGEGWVVLVENDDEDLGQKPAIHVMKIEGPPYRGELRVIDSVDNVFDEKLTLRHTGDFGGEPEKFCFEWRIAEDVTGLPPALPPGGPWQLYDDGGDPCGKLDITIKGSNPRTLMDNWVTVRYDYHQAFPFLSATAGYPWSQYAPAQLAQGWIKRVVSKLNPFEARVRDFHASPTNTLANMIAQIGGRYEGPVAMNSDANNLNSIGLIEAYETVLRQGLIFSIDAMPPVSNESVNKALLFISSRLADFWALLGNEAYADAVDPTIGMDTESTIFGFGSVAPAIFCFQNQVDSLLDEELTLLRGRDDTSGRVDRRPVYNRLTWNFTGAEGEVAYAVSYNISDWNNDGLIDEYDAAAMFPQGHGDAWGHYLSALMTYYRLLGHPYYDWVPRAESVLVGGAPVLVDFKDERKFAAIAASRARAGYDITDLTYRKNFVDDPAGQWQGYTDTYADRAWGVDEWGRRAGQAALFDWVAANAIVPENALYQDRVDDDGNVIPAADIQQIMRSKVPELDAIASKFQDIQTLMDKADRGLNPLGLAKGTVPFDISPSELPDSTHFEQIYERARKAMSNAVTVFDYANSFSRMLRHNQDSLEDFRRSVNEQERDYLSRLIEIYGYPYPEDSTYRDGYNGPDTFHYMYVDVPQLTGELPTQGGTVDENVLAYTVDFNFAGDKLDPELGITSTSMPVTFHLNTDRSWLEKPAGWSSRRAPGEIQMALSELIKAHADYQRALSEYDGILGGIKDKKDLLEARYDVAATQIQLLDENNQAMNDLNEEIRKNTIVATVFRRTGEITKDVLDGIVSGWGAADALIVPGVVLGIVGAGVKGACDIIGDAMDLKNLDAQMAKEEFQRGTDMKMAVNDSRYEVLQLVKELEASVSDLIAKKQELYLLKEVIHQNVGQFQMLLAEGDRLFAEREQQRKYAAADVQQYRYQDMAYRVFRNDALQKYRAQFDVAARYTYLAAAAYDYETNLLGASSGSGRRFLTDIVRQRSLGQFLEGEPVAGQPGLCDPLARMAQNFDVYKSQLGFNNPQYEGNRFSLKKELLRLADGDWSTALAGYRVDNLWQVPEFKRNCRPFAPESLGSQPALVIPFSSTVTFGQNFFGNPLGGGDSSYDPTNFATKVRSVGVWFEGYDAAGLSYTPRVYLVPVGADVLRSPSDNTFATREWKVVDQKLPVPFPIGESDLQQPDWIPLNDTLGEDFGGIRRFSSFRAYHDSGDEEWSHDETTQDSRLVGRSVWNTKWLLIIPGGTLLYDSEVGLDTFIDTVTDIKLYFSTYAYSGN